MRLTFLKISIDNYPILKETAKREGILFGKKTDMWLVSLNDVTIGCMGILLMKNKAVLKCDFIYPQYRGNRHLDDMIKYRLNLLRNYPFIQSVTANCTPLAVKAHIRNGASLTQKFKNGITKVTYENIFKGDRS